MTKKDRVLLANHLIAAACNLCERGTGLARILDPLEIALREAKAEIANIADEIREKGGENA